MQKIIISSVAIIISCIPLLSLAEFDLAYTPGERHFEYKKIAFSPDSKLLAVAGRNDGERSVKVFSISKRELVADFIISVAVDVKFSPDGKLMAFGGYDKIKEIDDDSGVLKLCDTDTWSCKNVVDIPYYDRCYQTTKRCSKSDRNIPMSVESVSFSKDGKSIAVAFHKIGTPIYIFDVETGKRIETIASDIQSHYSRVLYSHDGSLLLVINGYSNKGSIFDVKNNFNLIKSFDGASQWDAIAFAPNGKQLTIGTNDKGLSIVDLDGFGKKNLSGHTFSVPSAAYSPDGKLLATGGADSMIIFYDSKSAKELKTITVRNDVSKNNDEISDIAFSPNGRLFAAAFSGRASVIRLWTTDEIIKMKSSEKRDQSQLLSRQNQNQQLTKLSSSEDNKWSIGWKTDMSDGVSYAIKCGSGRTEFVFNYTRSSNSYDVAAQGARSFRSFNTLSGAATYVCE